jgi:hypothetical protein
MGDLGVVLDDEHADRSVGAFHALDGTAVPRRCGISYVPLVLPVLGLAWLSTLTRLGSSGR